MDQAELPDALVISRAIVVWIGKGKTMYPKPDTARLVEAFGAETAMRLVPVIQALQNEFCASDASNTIADLKQMGDVAAEQFRQRHPELTDEAVDALTWCYTFDYK